jgi:hypothetical protein
MSNVIGADASSVGYAAQPEYDIRRSMLRTLAVNLDTTRCSSQIPEPSNIFAAPKQSNASMRSCRRSAAKFSL